MSNLKGKVAVITGANSGIGLATAKRFLAEGAARVYVTARRQAELDRAVAGLKHRSIRWNHLIEQRCLPNNELERRA